MKSAGASGETPTDFPQAGGHWLFGHAAQMMSATHLVPAEVAAGHGGAAWFRVLHKRFLAVSDPELVRQVLVTRHEKYERSFHYRNMQAVVGHGLLSTDGPFWLKRRRQILPAFRLDGLQRMAPAAQAATKAMLDHWAAECRAGRPIRAISETQHLSLAVIGRALLSADIDRDSSARFGAIVRDGLYWLRRRNTSLFMPPPWMPTGANRHLRRTRRLMDDYVNAHISERHGCPVKHDILETMRAVREPDGSVALDDAALRDESKTLFIAGFETTATSLAWMLYALASRPELVEQIHDELSQVLAGDAPDLESMKRLPLTQATINETMRFYPSVYHVSRQAIEDDEFNGRQIPRGSQLLLSIFGMHRDPALWGDPDAFRPQRFMEAGWPSQAFMPFIIGKHACIGNHFAMIEMTIALAMIVQRYRLELADPAPVGMIARITLAPDRDISLRLVPR
ncbi:cytochrome P450 [Ferrovibrio sp.]|jgi:cytochrome P450|uniref:cytochrome P450 n=1 Tax=Ferrovibrio sp. TaxID=1917215 RepID=UPI0035AE25D1